MRGAGHRQASWEQGRSGCMRAYGAGCGAATEFAEAIRSTAQHARWTGTAYWVSHRSSPRIFALLSESVALSNPPGFQGKDLVRLGERIYRGGIADRQIAACAGCHSPNGAGIPAQYPRLSGQHADYTTAQMKAFRSGERKNSVQMTQIAAYMSDKEIAAVADYIAGLR